MSVSAAEIPDKFLPSDRRRPSQHSLLRPGQEGRGLEDPDDPPDRAVRVVPGQHQRDRSHRRRAKETCDLWDEIEECVSGFNVQIINQSSHLIFWLTNLNAWYGRANDGLSTLALSGALTKYHGWNYEFTMTQTVPRLMSFPTERTEILLRFETGQAVGRPSWPPRRSGSATSSSPSAASRAASRRRSASRRTSSSPGATPWATRSRTPRPAASAPASSSRSCSTRTLRTPLQPDPAVDGGPQGQGRHPGAGPAPGPHPGARPARRQVLAVSRASCPGPPRKSGASSTTTTGTSARTSRSGPRRSSPRAGSRTTPRR